MVRLQETHIYLALTSALTLVIAFVSAPAGAGSPADICRDAVDVVAREFNVPSDVLEAITLTETGRKRSGGIEPWPWTVNMEGKGVWFETEDDARAYVYEHFKRGARSFDVGCFQLNYKWHHQGFASIDEMFDPLAGGRYAAQFLNDLFREKGTWKEAAGAYHSRTPEFAERYMAKFSQHRERLSAKDNAAPPMNASRSTMVADGQGDDATGSLPTQSRVNNFPLLQTRTGTAGTFGSLVPLGRARSTQELIDLDGTG